MKWWCHFDEIVIMGCTRSCKSGTLFRLTIQMCLSSHILPSVKLRIISKSILNILHKAEHWHRQTIVQIMNLQMTFHYDTFNYCTISTHLPLVPHIYIYMHQLIGSVLVQIMACHLFGAKPLSEPMLGYYLVQTHHSNVPQFTYFTISKIENNIKVHFKHIA